MDSITATHATSRLPELKLAAQMIALQSCQLFQKIEAANLRPIAEITISRSLKKGECICHEGATGSAFFVVQTGALKLHRVSASGKEQVLHVYRAGEAFGMEILTGSDYLGTARAVQDSVVLLVQRVGFMDLLRSQPELGFCLLRAAARQVNQLMDLITDLKLKSVPMRVASWLVDHSPESDHAVKIELTTPKWVLASELGTSSETFCRTLAKFRKRGLLVIDGPRLTLTSRRKMALLAENGLIPSIRGKQPTWSLGA